MDFEKPRDYSKLPFTNIHFKTEADRQAIIAILNKPYDNIQKNLAEFQRRDAELKLQERYEHRKAEREARMRENKRRFDRFRKEVFPTLSLEEMSNAIMKKEKRKHAKV